MAADPYEYNFEELSDPIEDAVEVVPSDSESLPFVTRNLYIGGDGNVRVKLKDGAIVTYVGLVAGTEKQGRFTQIFATGTTATNLVAEV